MVELFILVFLIALVVRWIERRLEKRQSRLDTAYRRARAFAVSRR
ncbi:MAG: hypothetical protein ACPGOY_08205 [Rhodospirillaceae bacterium]